MPYSAFKCNFSPFIARGEQAFTFYSHQLIPPNFYPNQPLIYRHILYRRALNKDTVIVVVGNKRSGKSYFSLRAIQDLTRLEKKEFDVDKQVFFDPLPFFQFMKSSEDGYCLLEEVGVGYNAQDWHTLTSKIFRNILQTQGFRRNVIFMTLPNIAYLLKGARFLINFGVETVETGVVDVSKVVVKHLLGKGFMSYIENIRFTLPDKANVEKYEAMKKIWNDKHLDEDIEYYLDIEEQQSKLFTVQFDKNTGDIGFFRST